ncbi:MAG TPA: amidohydrolase family protein [Longimicrobiales bacterium]|nr:amidohydrolase family protein [Longimicrobiales bacterium]
MRAAAFVLAACAVAGPAGLAAQANPGQEGTFVIRGATVWTGTGQTLENTNVVIRDGRIEAVGPAATAAGATEIDGSGKFVYPGMIDAYTPLGLSEIGGIATMNLRSEMGEFNPHMRAVVAINVDSDMMAITRANGVTTAITAPSGGMISGQAALINMAGWTWEDMAVEQSAAYVLNYPRQPSFRFGGGGPNPAAERSARERVAEQVRELKTVLRTARAYDQARAAGSEQTDLMYEALRPLMRGEVPALISADTDEQIREAVELGREFGIRVIINGGQDAWKVRDLLAQHNVPVVLGSIQSTPAADAPYDALFAQPGVLHEAGVKFAFSTGGSANARHVPYHAALAVGYGLPKDAAMRALTIWPAEMFGAADQIGTIEAGKLANLFVATGDPLDIRTQVSELFIKGRRVPMDDRHSRLYEKYNARPERN